MGESCADGGSRFALLTAGLIETGRQSASGLDKKRRLPHNAAQCSTMAHNGTTSRATIQHQTKWLLSAARCFTFGDKEPRLIMPICQIHWIGQYFILDTLFFLTTTRWREINSPVEHCCSLRVEHCCSYEVEHLSSHSGSEKHSALVLLIGLSGQNSSSKKRWGFQF